VVAFAGVVEAQGLFTRTGVEEHLDECQSCRHLLANLIRESTHAWYAGQQVGRYELVEPIGRGGMGAVWRAVDPELGRAVALKRLHTGGRDRLFREARTLAQLQHPNVIAVYEVVDDEHAPFLAMELVEGVTLTAWMREPRSMHDIIAMLVQAGRGLAAAHGRGLVHRDFKPDNVLVDRDGGRARVADFGLASIDDSDLAAGSSSFCKLARSTASVAGTPAYMAPELLDGTAPDVRSDVFAFAITLYEALQGQHPFAGDSMKERWIEMAAGRVRPNARRLPRAIDRLVRKGLAADPAERWQNIGSFVTALERRPRRTIAIAAGSAAAMLAVGTIAAFATTRGNSVIDECTAAADIATETWNPFVRESLVAKIALSSPDRTPADATAGIVDHWVKKWQAGRRAACTAGERRASRVACLDHELSELKGLIDTWSAGTGLERSVSAAAALPAPTACNSAADSPLVAQPLLVRITEAKTLYRSGRSPEAEPLLEGLLRDAEGLGHHDTLAQALLISSYIEHDLGNDTDATAHARRAAAEASKAGDDALLYLALVQQAYQQIDSGAPADALGMLDAAEALAARGVPNPEKVLMARGGALMRLGRTPESIAQYDKVIAMLETTANPDPTATIGLGIALAGRGNAYLEQREPERAAVDQKRALELQEKVYGPRHPEVARTLYDLAQSEGDMNQLDAGAAHLARARDIFIGAYGEAHPEVGQVDVARATNAKRGGRIDEARALYEQAQNELSGALPPNHLLFSVIENQRGALEIKAGRCSAAIPHFEAGRRILTANHVGGDELANTDVDLARCLLEVGNHVDAKSRAEEAIDEMSRAGIDEKHRVVPWATLASVAARRGDRTTAISLARKVLATTTDADTGSRAEARADMKKLLRSFRLSS